MTVKPKEYETWDAIPDGLSLHGGEERWLRCPECHDSYVHFDSPIEHITDEYTCPTGERGTWIDLPAWCESGDHFHLVIAFHKGNTSLHVLAGEEGSGDSSTRPLPERGQR
jgi:hypothetical protein